MLRTLVFLSLITSAFASLDALVNASANFSAVIEQQFETLQRDPSPADFAEKTIWYARAKTAYCKALREAMPELINIATGKEARPLEADRFCAAFSAVGEEQEAAADEVTTVFLRRFSGNTNVKKAGAEFERAQKAEQAFHKDFDGQDFTSNSLPEAH
jgi:hypothetical protein